ncbi:Na+/H+ antiporter subunit E [Sphingomonas turrisvirgatae]|uniref:Na+/H+ antiporter subunit E n=1 Tax=Sphingomonas turrisvirgatae TaxID=1888892 RepID=A0A1E3LVW5_9SPHN|nr:Na+/H+ antiporter subunit E [Sphingomonas turrisvirgatae]ODP37275.1 Na+/H+ antiporter subunit E [Sphingomonas turrisvirgatae]
MTRFLPHPFLAAALLLVWLLLTQSFSPGQVLLGSLVAWLASLAFAALRPDETRKIRLRPAFRLAGLVATDILRSNLAVASIVMSRRADRVSGFVRVPIDLTHRDALALLALIITMTPGTLWVDFDRRSGRLLIHVLDLVDESEWVRLIKGRYERLLMEMFHQ